MMDQYSFGVIGPLLKRQGQWRKSLTQRDLLSPPLIENYALNMENFLVIT